MYSTEFLYWMQGFFEVMEPKKVTDNQLRRIRNHLDMALLTGTYKRTHPFCVWLKENLSAVSKASDLDLELIRSKLDDCFEHVVAEKLKGAHRV